MLSTSFARTLLGYSLATLVASTGCDAPSPAADAVTNARELHVENIDVDGREIRFQLSAPLADTALVAVRPELQVDGPDPITDELVSRTMVSEARLEDDGFVLVLTAPEALDRSHAYEARLVLVDGTIARLGDPEVPEAQHGRAATVKVVSSDPQDKQGYASANKALAARVSRTKELVTINFSGPIDCAEMKKQGAAALRIYNPNQKHAPGFSHDFYHNAKYQDPEGVAYSGTIECAADKKSIDFLLPGRLYGGAEYYVRVRAPYGDNQVAEADYKFKTENPGLRVNIKLASPAGINYNCESWVTDKAKRCDAYILLNGAAGNVKTSKGIYTESTLGTWNNWHGSQNKFMNHAWLDTTQPVTDDVILTAAAFDDDENKKAENFALLNARVHEAVGAGLSAAGNPYGALVLAVGGVFEGVKEALSGNEDDYLGLTVIRLSKNGDNDDLEHVADWWGMYRDKDSTVDPWDPLYWQYGRRAKLESSKHGVINLYYLVQEAPESYQPIPIVL